MSDAEPVKLREYPVSGKSAAEAERGTADAESGQGYADVDTLSAANGT